MNTIRKILQRLSPKARRAAADAYRERSARNVMLACDELPGDPGEECWS